MSYRSLTLLLAALAWRAAAAADTPPSTDSGAPPRLLPIRSVPARDTLESPPEPLLVPGRPGTADTLKKSRSARAREQLRLGRALEHGGHPAPAIAAYRNAVQLEPSIPDANYRMGMLFLSVGQIREAVKCFDAEVRRHPGNLAAVRELGLGLARVGEPDRAIAQLGILTRRRPNDGDSWQALGFAYMAAKRPREAEIVLRRAVVLPPARADKHRDLGAVLAARGKEADARAQYLKAIALDPRDASTWINLGNLERRAAQLERALDDYREAERRDSTLDLAFQGQVRTLSDLGRVDGAAAVYRRWLKSQPANNDARLEAVRTFDSLDRKDIALELARDGVRRNERSGDAHLILGMALEASGATRAALGEMRKAEGLFDSRAGRERARQLIAALRASAADSLKSLFAADSTEHAQAAR